MLRLLTPLLAIPVYVLALGCPVEPLSAQTLQPPDTTWVDEPRPYLSTDALQRLREIWSGERNTGACLLGTVEEVDGRRAVRVTTATAAAFPERCTGFTRYVGAAVFLRDRQDEGQRSPRDAARSAACALLREHPEWAVAAGIYGFESRLTTRDGRIIEQAGVPSAWFCTWLKSGTGRQEAVPGDSIRSG